MAAENVIIQVFYSWQSDLPNKTNLEAIRIALKQACERLEAAVPNLKLVPDEATRDTSGGINIAFKIIEKIEAAAIFIADITTVTAPGAPRPCPNPNVGYELGYAAATLGWERIILLFNKAFGQFPSDLPFDFAQHRAHTYHFTNGDQPSSKYKELSKFLEIAIKTILDKSPKRPAESREVSREKLQHVHDVENMRWLMETLHIPTIQSQIEELPRVILDRAIWFFENYRSVVDNSLFAVYDPILKAAIAKLYTGWQAALSHDEEYHETPRGKSHVFTNPGDLPLPPDRQEIWDTITVGRHDMAEGLAVILDRLRTEYLEISIQNTSAKAWNTYIEFQREIEK